MNEDVRGVGDSLNLSISDEDLLSKLTNTEDNFVERKTVKNTRGWLHTAVAFANSCPVGFPGVLLVGVNNNGSVQRHEQAVDFEDLQKQISNRINEAWPPIYHYSKILRREVNQFVAVIIPGSELRPHFSGKAFVRVGPQTKDASEEQYESLIAERSATFRALQKLIGREVFWNILPNAGNGNAILAECNKFFVTLDGVSYKRCFPTDWITLSFDPTNRRFQLIVERSAM